MLEDSWGLDLKAFRQFVWELYAYNITKWPCVVITMGLGYIEPQYKPNWAENVIYHNDNVF